MAADIKIDFYDEEGNPKTKEQFISEMEDIYDNVVENVPTNYFMQIMSQINFDPNEVLGRYHYIDRKLYIDGEVDGDLASEFLMKIQLWNSEDEINQIPVEERAPIQIYINTPGGDVDATWQIIDTITNSQTPVVTIVTSRAYSAGFFIAIAGDRRYAFPHAYFVFHEGSVSFGADCHKFLQFSDNHKKMIDAMRAYVLSNTCITEELYEQHRNDDWYFNVEDALKYNLIDSVAVGVNGELEIDDEQEEEQE